MKVKSESEDAQSCTTLSDPMDCSLPGSSVHGIFQARVLEWVATAFSLKLLEENIGRTLDDINQSKILYDLPPTVTEIKTKVNKWDLIKLKSFCTANKTKQGEKTLFSPLNGRK